MSDNAPALQGESTTVAPAVIRFRVPLPPPVLRANSRAFWATKKKAADDYSRAVWGWYAVEVTPYGFAETLPWKRARVTFTWRSCGPQPDHSNLGGNTKYLLDIMAVAPVLPVEQAEKYCRYHLGIIENDRGVVAEYRMEKVGRRAAEGVIVCVERIDEQQWMRHGHGAEGFIKAPDVPCGLIHDHFVYVARPGHDHREKP